MSLHVFVGPTLPAETVREIAPEAQVHPPVAHGDLLRFEFAPDDVVVIIDGYYHQAGAVRHKEILTLLADGVRVVGCSSMGALRAAELDAFGMVGHGAVYEMYRAGTVEADDEVAVAHAEEPPFRRYSEPLVNIRYAIGHCVQEGLLASAEAEALLAVAASLPYTARSWRLIERISVADKNVDPGSLHRLREFLSSHPETADIKAADAVDTLTGVTDIANRGLGVRQWMAAQEWRSAFLHDWQAEFTGNYVEDIFVSHRDVLGYCQIYDTSFPARWQEYALDRIGYAGSESSEDVPRGLRGALLGAAAAGLEPGAACSARAADWLTPPELRELSAEEQFIRMLVRSYQPPRHAVDLMAAWPDMFADATTRTVVAECHAVNAQVAGWGAGHSIYHLKTATLRDHLGQVWQLIEPTDDYIVAAARDRGFSSVPEALRTARSFFLRSRFLAPNPAAGKR